MTCQAAIKKEHKEHRKVGCFPFLKILRTLFRRLFRKKKPGHCYTCSQPWTAEKGCHEESLPTPSTEEDDSILTTCAVSNGFVEEVVVKDSVDDITVMENDAEAVDEPVQEEESVPVQEEGD